MRLSKRWVRKLVVESPESGIGYQNILIVLKTGAVLDVTVSDCEYVLTDCVFNTEDIMDVRLND